MQDFSENEIKNKQDQIHFGDKCNRLSHKSYWPAIWKGSTPDKKWKMNSKLNSCMHWKTENFIKNQGSMAFNQHLLETRPGHRSLATSQTSELVGKAPKTCNSYPDAIFKWHH